MRTISMVRFLMTAALVVPVALSAQGGEMRGEMRGPRPPVGGMVRGAGAGMGMGGVTQILNARRQLELTARQVTQLDELERGVFAERKALQTRLQAQRDSNRARAQAAPMARDSAARPQRRSQMEAQMNAMRPLMQQLRAKDSTANEAALRVLTDTQRQQWREMLAERRGRLQGMRDARGFRGEVQRGVQRGGRMMPHRGGRGPAGAPPRPPRGRED